MAHGGILHPRIPKTDTTQEKKHIDTDITTAAQAKKGVRTRQRHMKQDDEDDGCPHQLATIATHLCQLDIPDLHNFGAGIRSMTCLTAQERAIVTTT